MQGIEEHLIKYPFPILCTILLEVNQEGSKNVNGCMTNLGDWIHGNRAQFHEDTIHKQLQVKVSSLIQEIPDMP